MPPDKVEMIPVCLAEGHTTDEMDYDSVLGWGGWCYQCGPISEARLVPKVRCDCCGGRGWIDAPR
jgi:rRNA maturation endonuclease Nob1